MTIPIETPLPAPANVNVDLRPTLYLAAQRFALAHAAEPGSIEATLAIIDRIKPAPPRPALTVIEGGRDHG